MQQKSHWLSPVTLTGTHVQLLPLERSHKAPLLQAAGDGSLWELWYTSVPSSTTIDAYLEAAIESQSLGHALPFVVFHHAEQTPIGMTRYCNADAKNRRLEIGYTWYAARHQRTGVNTESKFLLLRHAFEVLDCIAVEFRTNWFNLPSRAAIARLGAHQDGVLRHHRINPDGTTRDTVVFSITKQEWPSVKKSLALKMMR